MTDTPQPGAIPQPDLSNPSSVSQQQNPKAQAQPVMPEQVRANQPAGAGSLDQILAYFRSQGAPDNHVIGTFGGIQLRISDLRAAQQQPTPAAPPAPPSPVESDAPVHEDEFKS